VPLGISRFPKYLILLAKVQHHTMGPVVYDSEHESGEYFTAWGRPNAIVKDLRAMFGKDSDPYECVEGKNSYTG
jgi:hypothetical protein